MCIINIPCSQLKQKEEKKSVRRNDVLKKLYFYSIKQIKIVNTKCLF